MVRPQAAEAHYLRAPPGTHLVHARAFQRLVTGQHPIFRGSFAWHDPC